MARYELVTDTAQDTPSRTSFVWSRDGRDSTSLNVSRLDPWLSSLGRIPPSVSDLVRIAFAALLADRAQRRGEYWTRSVDLRVYVAQPRKWTKAIGTVEALLGYLSGDTWTIEFAKDEPLESKVPKSDLTRKAVYLFSGGLDSFAAAIIAQSQLPHEDLTFISHRDNTVIAGAQNRSTDWLKSTLGEGCEWLRFGLRQAGSPIEASSRTRAFLFMALGVAAAAARGAKDVLVPENGFTSLNPPLQMDRAGSLSTRSTHPETFRLFSNLLVELGIEISVTNPYEWHTKGELLKEAQALCPTLENAIALTFSCGKIDGRVYKGGNVNHNCGLCFSCVVRRSSIAAAGLTDRTTYLVHELKKTPMKKLIKRRRSDIAAMKWMLATGVDSDDLIASSPFPRSFDFDHADQLLVRALKELNLVELP